MRAYQIAIALGIALSTGVAMDSLRSQAPAAAQDTSGITGGSYAADPNHSQVLFGFNHMGFTNNLGLFGLVSGTLTLDPKAPEKAVVDVTVPINSLATGVAEFNEHLAAPDFFDTANHPTATFKSTAVKVDGTEAEITGNLTIKGITKEVTLDAKLIGTGANPMSKKETIGFSAETVVKRSDFGLGKYVPVVGDTVELKIVAAFQK